MPHRWRQRPPGARKRRGSGSSGRPVPPSSGPRSGCASLPATEVGCEPLWLRFLRRVRRSPVVRELALCIEGGRLRATDNAEGAGRIVTGHDYAGTQMHTAYERITRSDRCRGVAGKASNSGSKSHSLALTREGSPGRRHHKTIRHRSAQRPRFAGHKADAERVHRGNREAPRGRTVIIAAGSCLVDHQVNSLVDPRFICIRSLRMSQEGEAGGK